MSKNFYLFIFIFSFSVLSAQEKLSKEEIARREKNVQAGNPFAKYGSKAPVATLSKGKYLEVHDLDSIVTIGTTRWHVDKKQIVGNIVIDSLNVDAQPVGDRAGRWMSPDPLSEEFPSTSPYVSFNNNPLRFADPNGMAPVDLIPPDDFVFNEKGKYIRTDKNNSPDRLVIENSKTGFHTNYNFADPKNDADQIRNGTINRVEFVSVNQVENMLKGQGAFKSDYQGSYSSFYKESKGGGDFDYSYSVLPDFYGNKGASTDPLNNPASLLFIPEGGFYAHNQMNFGNFLWAATGATLGFDYSTIQLGAQFNSIFNSSTNGYSPQWDSKDDQLSIIQGAYFSIKNKFSETVKNIEALQTNKSERK